MSIAEETILNRLSHSEGPRRSGPGITARSRFLGIGFGLTALAVSLTGCGLFSSGPTPGVSPGASGVSNPTASTTSSPTAAPVLIKSITLVAALGEPKGATPAGLTWAGIQATAARLDATATLVEPATNADLSSAIDKAAGADLAVVVTVGPDAQDAVLAASAAHPKTQFLEMDVAPPDGAPANLHGLVFDQAEAGYLAGYVAAWFSATAGVGFVGDAASDRGTANYAAGFPAGAAQAKPATTVTVGYAGTADAPDKGRTAAAAMIKSGSDIVVALPSLSGIGAMRETCGRKARLVTVGTDAWQVVPDVQPCLIASVVNRYDTAVGTALLVLAAGTPLPQREMNDVSNDGIAVGEFHADLPAGFEAGLAGVMATLRNGPPRATAGPATDAPSAAPGGKSSSPKASGT